MERKWDCEDTLVMGPKDTFSGLKIQSVISRWWVMGLACGHIVYGGWRFNYSRSWFKKAEVVGHSESGSL